VIRDHHAAHPIRSLFTSSGSLANRLVFSEWDRIDDNHPETTTPADDNYPMTTTPAAPTSDNYPTETTSYDQPVDHLV
jgi:hypothetical protein